MFPEITKAIDKFQQEMASVDEVAHVLLKGHLLIEESLVRIVEQYLFHREHLAEARLSFHQKMTLCQALCLRKNAYGEWDLISSINSLRNEIAHQLNSATRNTKMSRTKEIFFREAAAFKGIDEIKKESDAGILLKACALCSGFLATFEADSKGYRAMIHALDREHHPKEPPFEL